MAGNDSMRTAQSVAVDARHAAREFHAAVAQVDRSLVLFFCSSRHDLDDLETEMDLLFPGVQMAASE